MPTILDQLTIELGWDVRKFLEGAKDTENIVRQRHQDFERQSKVWQSLLGDLNRLLMRVAAAFISIETAIRGFELSKTLSRSGTEFANLAESIGMSVTQLSLWEQAIERVGGRAQDAGDAFKYQQSEFQKTRTGLQGAPFMGPGGFGYMQRLGMPEWSQYFDQRTGQYDLDRFNKDLFDALNRYRDPKSGLPLSAAERLEYLKGFGWSGTAAQRLFGIDLRGELEKGRAYAPTRENIETFRRLNELWSKLGQSVNTVGRDLVTNLEKPISLILEGLTKVTELVHQHGWSAMFDDLKRQYEEEGFFKFFFSPHVYDDQGRGHAVPWSEFLGTAPASPNASTAPGTGRATDWLGLTGPRTWGSWWQGLTGVPPSPPPPAAGSFAPPASSGGGPAASSAPPASPGGALMPMPVPAPPAAPPASFDERFNAAVPRRQSMLDTMTDLPRRAASLSAVPAGGSTSVVNNTTTTIGAMSFHSRASDTEMGIAPSTVAKDLSIGQYAIQANSSLE